MQTTDMLVLGAILGCLALVQFGFLSAPAGDTDGRNSANEPSTGPSDTALYA